LSFDFPQLKPKRFRNWIDKVNAAPRGRTAVGTLIVLRRRATLDLLLELLRSQPWPTFIATSSAEARGMLELCIPNRFVIDLDLEQSSLLLRDVRRKHPEADVIAVTDSDERANLSRQQGIDKVLTSPGKESFIDSLMFLLGVEHKTKQGPQVLLATPDREELVTVAAFLTRSGYSVQVADSGPAARQILESDPSIRLLLLDLQLVDGALTFLRKIARDFPNTGVIMMSSIDDREVARLTTEIGALDYVVKPTAPHNLVDAVEAGIARLDYRTRHGGSWWQRLFGQKN
jgi:DNA-binding response OmpR family regulator